MSRRWEDVRKMIAAGALLAFCSAPALGRQPPEPSVWNDPERFRALAERAEPWPLRDQLPPPWTSPPPKFLCGPGEGLPVLIGEARIRLPFFNFVIPLDPNERVWDPRQRTNDRLQRGWLWAQLPREAKCRAPADWAAAPRLGKAYLEFLGLATGALDPRCHRPGLPGDPRPECDRPRDSAWWFAFARGLPLDITLEAPDLSRPAGTAAKRVDLERAFPGHRLEPRPRGGWTVLAAGGARRIGVVLERADDVSADTEESLRVGCLLNGYAWQPPEVHAAFPRAWSRCEVSFRFRGVIDVAYRFYREVFDEPDIPALDKRVRDLVGRTLEGAETLPPPEMSEW
jgi:hypothetical protein